MFHLFQLLHAENNETAEYIQNDGTNQSEVFMEHPYTVNKINSF